MKRLATFGIALLLGATACSGDSATGQGDNSGWELGDDAGNNASDAGANNANNGGGTNNPNNAPTNNAPSNNTTPTNNAPTNNATNNQTGSTNNTNQNTNGNTMGNGSGVEGDPCAVNSNCGANLTCCQGFDGNATCQPQCFGGGLCAGNDAECATDEVCCDLSGINQPDSCVAPNWCRNQGNMGTPCTTNSDCMDPEVCCLGFDGTGECTTDCFSGGACNDDTECRNGQQCCDINVAKVCFDQCSF